MPCCFCIITYLSFRHPISMTHYWRRCVFIISISLSIGTVVRLWACPFLRLIMSFIFLSLSLIFFLSLSLTPTSFSIQGQDMDLSGIDVWSPDFDPTSVFDEESLKEITDFFVKNAGDKDGVIRWGWRRWGEGNSFLSLTSECSSRTVISLLD